MFSYLRIKQNLVFFLLKMMLYTALHQMLVLDKSKITVKHQKYSIQYCQNCQIPH